MRGSDPIWPALAVLGCALALYALIWIVSSYFEASTYSRVTGIEVTAWDAMWVELRVDGGPR